jgi:hypothetical protein
LYPIQSKQMPDATKIPPIKAKAYGTVALLIN